MAHGDINPKTKFKRAVYGYGICQYCFVSFLLKVQSLHKKPNKKCKFIGFSCVQLS